MNWDAQTLKEELAVIRESDLHFFHSGRSLRFRAAYGAEKAINGLAGSPDIWALVLEVEPGRLLYYFIHDPELLHDDGRDFNESDDTVVALWTLADDNRIAAGKSPSGICLDELSRIRARKTLRKLN